MAMSNTKEILVAVVGSGVVLLATVKLVRRLFTPEKKKEYPKDVVILFQIPRTPAAPNLSPFAIKLETYLRMAKIPYQNEYTLKMSPKHKTPWIMYNDEVISDSQFIIEFLNKKLGIDLSKHLTSRDRAVSHAMRKMTEESLYWTLVLSRWVYGYNDPSLLKIVPISKFILWRAHSLIKGQTYQQGYGRHTPEEVETICRQDLQALSDQIGRNLFLMGNHPCEADCAVFGMLAMLWMMPDNSFVTQKILKDNVYPNLTTYCEKMKKEFWPDFEQKKLNSAEKKNEM